METRRLELLVALARLGSMRAVGEELGITTSTVSQQLAALSAETLLEKRSAHAEEATVLWCVYHIVEHFSMHTGQILSMAKALVGDSRPSAAR